MKPDPKKFGIQILTELRTFILNFENEEEQKRWISALHAAVVVAKLRKNALKSSFGVFWTSSIDICKLLQVSESNILQALEQRGFTTYLHLT